MSLVVSGFSPFGKGPRGHVLPAPPPPCPSIFWELNSLTPLPRSLCSKCLAVIQLWGLRLLHQIPSLIPWISRLPTRLLPKVPSLPAAADPRTSSWGSAAASAT